MLLLQDVPAPPAPPEVVVVSQGPGNDPSTWPPEVFVMVILAGLAFTALMLWPLVRALARRLEGGSTAKLQAELDDIRARLDAIESRSVTSGEFDAAQHRLYDIEERLEFAERMFTRPETPKQGGA
jgi:tetrahydromethanopterin S-methyltransferase subunit G